MGTLRKWRKGPWQGAIQLEDQMSKIKWATDIDGVLCNFFQGIIQYSKKFGLRDHFPKRWDLLGSWLGPEDHFQTVYDACISDKDFWLGLKPMKSAHLALTGSTMKKPDLYLTARKIPNEWTQEWLELNGFPKAEVVTVGHTKDFKAMELKLEVLKNKGIDIYIDDYPDTVAGLLDHGIGAVLYSARHNKTETLPRIENYSEIFPILAIAENKELVGAKTFIQDFFSPFSPNFTKSVV